MKSEGVDTTLWRINWYEIWRIFLNGMELSERGDTVNAKLIILGRVGKRQGGEQVSQSILPQEDTQVNSLLNWYIVRSGLSLEVIEKWNDSGAHGDFKRATGEPTGRAASWRSDHYRNSSGRRWILVSSPKRALRLGFKSLKP